MPQPLVSLDTLSGSIRRYERRASRRLELTHLVERAAPLQPGATGLSPPDVELFRRYGAPSCTVPLHARIVIHSSSPDPHTA